MNINKYSIKSDRFLSDEPIGSHLLQKNKNCLDGEYNKTFHYSEKQRNAKDDGSIAYNYNLFGYRCDDFTKKRDKDKLRIVFSGCSETEGVGNNIENTWSFLFYKYLSQHYPTDGYFNLGMSGSGYQNIIANLFNFIKIYGNPDYIFILLPNIARWIEWIDDEKEYKQIGLSPWHDGHKDKDDTTIKIQRDILINFILTMRLFESYCKEKNIKLLWATWDQNDENNYLILADKKIFYNFININTEDIANTLLSDKNIKNPRQILARDNHLGTKFHELWTGAFIDNFIKQRLGEDNAKI